MAPITSAATGVWSAGGTWTGGVVPGEGDTVRIMNTHVITLDTTVIVGADSATPAVDILSGGTLNWDNLGSDTLTLKGDFYVRSGGTLTLNGTADGTKTLTVKLNYSASLLIGKYNLFVASGGTFTATGANKTRVMDVTSAQAASGQKNIVTINNNSSNWLAGDSVWITGIVDTTDDKEVNTISSISGTTIGLSYNLSKTYDSGTYILNLTRNIIITSYNTSYKGYIDVAGALNFDWVQTYRLGKTLYNDGGIHLSNASGTINIDYCVLHGAGNCAVALLSLSTITTFAYNIYYAGTVGTTGSYGQFATELTYSYCYFVGWGTALGYGTAIKSTLNNCFFEDCTSGYYSPGYVTIDDTIFKSCTDAINTRAGVKGIINNSTFIFNTYGINVSTQAGVDIEFNTCFFGTGGRLNVTSDLYLNHLLKAYFVDCTFESTTKVSYGASAVDGSYVRFKNCTGVSTLHKTHKLYGSYEKQSTIKHTGSYALLMSPTNASNELIAESTVPASNGVQIVVTAYFRKSVAMAILPYLRLSGVGMTTSTSTMTDSIDTWELLTVSGTPTEDGFAKVEFVCQNANGAVYVDDVKMVYTAIDTGSMDFWYEGDLPLVLLSTGLGALDVWNAQSTQVGSAGTMGEVLIDVPTKAELDAAVVLLAIEGSVEGHVVDAIVAYDPPTRAEAIADKDAIIAEVDANETKIDTVDTVVDAIKLKTDNLPVDPADESLVEAAIAAAEANIRGTDSDDLKVVSDQLDVAQADLDSPDQYKADVLLLAVEANVEGHVTAALTTYDPPTRAEATADKDEVITQVDANEVKINALQTDLTFLRDIEGGRWKIVGDQMIFYEADNVTEIARFNLFDESGIPTTDPTEIVERVRV